MGIVQNIIQYKQELKDVRRSVRKMHLIRLNMQCSQSKKKEEISKNFYDSVRTENDEKDA